MIESILNRRLPIYLGGDGSGTPPTPDKGKVEIKPNNEAAVVLERVPQRTEPPKMYQVVMLNDDYTPMEFVVAILVQFFNKDLDSATQIMLKIHLEGRGICGIYPCDIAQSKVRQVMDSARENGHPLQCVSEPLE